MGTDLGSFMSSFERRIVETVKKQVQPIYEQCIKDATEITFNDLEKYAKMVFTQAIDRFYSSYSPGYYGRTESLYDIFEIERGAGSITIGFHPENMSSSEGSLGSAGLYEQTFKRGWHGGAGSGPDHPAPGAPFWRTPYGVYKHWGRSAAVSTPPYEEISRRIEEYSRTVMQSRFNSTLQKLWAERISSIQLRF